jgi:hypothetical protein
VADAAGPDFGALYRNIVYHHLEAFVQPIAGRSAYLSSNFSGFASASMPVAWKIIVCYFIKKLPTRPARGQSEDHL